MDIVILPNFNRPEFLTVTLELIQKAHGFEKFLYLFVLDYGFNPELEQIALNWHYNKKILKVPKTSFKHTKQSYALYSGYKTALGLGGEYIHLIEDDIFISTDYFNWHKQAQQLKPFCSIATRNHKVFPSIIGKLRLAYEHNSYQSLGVCWQKDNLSKALNYFPLEYFQNPLEYTKKTFPNSKIPLGFLEQDSVINRLMEKDNLNAIYPYYPRAYHAGFYGKGRGIRLQGTTAQKVKQIKEIGFDKEKIKNRILAQGNFTPEDSVPVNLILPLTKDIVLRGMPKLAHSKIHN